MMERDARTAGRGGIRRIEVSDEELTLIRTGLELLEDTLGREEAEELNEVQALLARLRSPGEEGGAAA
jgi:hypothetical protein